MSGTINLEDGLIYENKEYVSYEYICVYMVGDSAMCGVYEYRKYYNLRKISERTIKRYSECNLYKSFTDGVAVVYPIEFLWKKNGNAEWRFYIEDCNKQYVLPCMIDAYYKEILEQFSDSIVYDQLCIRLCDLSCEKNKIELKTMRTTYFNSLVTNRSMDYNLNSKITIRNLYEPGPCLIPLPESRFSNHLGFNGIIETMDGVLVLVHRSKYVSVNKNLFECSVSASLKSKYALDIEKQHLTCSGLVQAVEKEIVDELNLTTGEYVDFSTNNILAFYRDITEGGKPNFIIYVKLKCSYSFLKSCVKAKIKPNDSMVLRDGFRYKWIYYSDFINAKIMLSKISVKTIIGNDMRKKVKETLLISPQTSGVMKYIQDYMKGALR